MVGASKAKAKTFTGGIYLRHRLILSTLSATPVRVHKIRPNDATAPGLAPFEISLIRLLDKISSGAEIEINETGTSISYKPGLLIGGDGLKHDCHPSRCLSYYLDALLMLAPFCKYALNISLRGATHGETDVCVDTTASVTVPLLRRLTLGMNLNPRVEIRKRATQGDARQNGGGKSGQVRLQSEIATTKLRAIDMTEAGYVKRVRGIAFGNRVSPGHMRRMIEAARSMLNNFSPDVYLHADHNNAPDCGVGYGLHVVAETTEGCLLGADWSTSRATQRSEDVAEASVSMLLEEIEAGGCIDSNQACMALLFCALADGDVSRIRIGRISEAAVQFLRDLEVFFGVRFCVRVLGSALRRRHGEQSDDSSDESEEEEEEEENGDEDGVVDKNMTKRGYGIMMSCIGVGHSNIARQRF